MQIPTLYKSSWGINQLMLQEKELEKKVAAQRDTVTKELL
jgi:hypothetical protein